MKPRESWIELIFVEDNPHTLTPYAFK